MATPAAAECRAARRASSTRNHHYYPPEYQKAWLDYEDKRGIPHFTQQVNWSVQGRARRHERPPGVRTAVLSIASTPGVWVRLERARGGPASCANATTSPPAWCATTPGRFGQFATLPMIDVDSTLKEIAYVFDVLKVDGIGLQTKLRRQVGRATRRNRPIFEELNRRKAVVYFHLLVAACCARLSVGTFPGGDRGAARHDACGS